MMNMTDGNQLPPGFLFSPTDEELVLHFLSSKAASSHFLPSNNIIPDLHLSHSDPWELNGKALSSGNGEYYFFTELGKEDERRATENGYWKEIGVTEPILSSSEKKVGMKKYLVFHIIPHGGATETETAWVMQEFHIFDQWSAWVLCRVYEKNCYSDGNDDDDDDSGTELSWLDEVYLSLDDPEEITSMPN